MSMRMGKGVPSEGEGNHLKGGDGGRNARRVIYVVSGGQGEKGRENKR